MHALYRVFVYKTAAIHSALAHTHKIRIIAYMHKAIVIVGTNASGKSSLAVELAKKHNGEIISADSRQVYRGLTIATGKVTKKEMGGIPHHLLDVTSPKKTFTAADFVQLGVQALEDIWERGKVPIIVGGTGFYVDALCGRISLTEVGSDEQLRRELGKRDVSTLFYELMRLDPTRARELKAKNEHNLKRRVIRSIELARSANSAKKIAVPKFTPLWLGISWNSEKLKERIHERTLLRLRQGMVAEAKKLHEKGLSWKRMEELGLEYRHLADYLRNKITKEELVTHINRDDWKYAKRQRTWFKRNKGIHWLENGKTKSASKLVTEFLSA